MQEQEVAMHKSFIVLKVRIKFVTFKLSLFKNLEMVLVENQEDNDK